MQGRDDFLSCDWGTSSFRLRWVSGADGAVRREIRAPVGVKSLHEQALAQASQAQPGGGQTHTARAALFAGFLRSQVSELFAKGHQVQRPMPLVISGMASSSIGWCEVPYASAPFGLDGTGLRGERLAWGGPPSISSTHLISGVATLREMMRGEETEIIGLMANPERASLRDGSLVILPGTHSKHALIEQGQVVDFQTYMTGELFDVLSRHSILRASVLPPGPEAEPGPAEQASFQEGVRWQAERGLAGSLFRVRSRDVLDRIPSGQNRWFLSGLLIGAEAREVARTAGPRPIVLAGAPHLASLYHLALETMGSKPWTRIPPGEVEHATIAGHAIFLAHLQRQPGGK